MQANTDHPAPSDHSVIEEGHPSHRKSTQAALALAALGVVFGDIGTSPLYALKDCVRHHGLGEKVFTETFILGSLSLIFWALTLVVNVKYLLVVLRATNHGEGGIFSLLSLRSRCFRRSRV